MADIMGIETAPTGKGIANEILNNIFSVDTLLNGADGSGVVNETTQTILAMLGTLNELALFALVFIFGVTSMTAIIGTSHEGTPMGKKLHSFWVPLRFTLATGMLVPLKSGLCAFQVIILLTTGWSVHFADKLWDTFLEKGIQQKVNNVIVDSSPTEQNLSYMAENIIQNMLMQEYGKTFINIAGDYPNPDRFWRTAYDGNTPTSMTLRFLNPKNKKVNKFEGMGEVVITIPPGTEDINPIRIAVEAFMDEVQGEIASIVRDVEHMNQIAIDRSVFDTATANMQFRLANVLKTSYKEEYDQLKGNSQTFIDTAKENGWIAAGGLYNTIASMQQKLNAIKLDISSTPPDFGLMYDRTQKYKVTMERILDIHVVTDINYDQVSTEDLITMARGGDINPNALLSYLFNGRTANQASISWLADNISHGDPVFAMAQFGDRILLTATGMLGGYATIKALATGGKKFLSDIPIIGSMSSSVLDGIGAFFSVFTPFLYLIFFSLLISGIAMVYYIPAVPFILWVSGVIGWILLVIEALVAAPLWIIGHAMPDGEGFSGDHGKQGYLLILGILVRPFLMLIALCLSIIVIDAVAKLVAQMFMIYGVGAADTISDIPVLSTIVYIVMFVTIMTVFCHKVFGMIGTLPSEVMKWLGGQARPLGEADDESKTENKVMGFANSVNNSGKQAVTSKPDPSAKGKGKEGELKDTELTAGDKVGKGSGDRNQDVGKSEGENDRG